VTEKNFRVTQNGVRFALRLTPKGGRDAIGGWSQGADGTSHLKARVSAAPEAGKANAALIVLLAKRLGIAKSRVAIVSGETARMKIVDIAGDGAALAAGLNALGDRQ
jgi:uncharacterized protein